MRLTPSGQKRSWGAVGAGVGSIAALITVALALGVPGQGGCGGLPDPSDPTGEATAALTSACVEQVVSHDGACVDTGSTGVRTCEVKGSVKSASCPKGCQAGVASFTWKDVFGETVTAPAADLSALCENRKPPGLDCSYVEHLPCTASTK